MRFCASAGITQFLDIGSGLPATGRPWPRSRLVAAAGMVFHGSFRSW